MKQKITDWLLSLEYTVSASPVTITIDGRTFEGAEYVKESPITSGCRAYDEGRRISRQQAIYLAGTRTAKMRKDKRVHGVYESAYVYTRPDDTRDWYIACYADLIPTDKAEYHPFGPSFILMPWDVPGGERIDHYDESKRERLAITIN